MIRDILTLLGACLVVLLILPILPEAFLAMAIWLIVMAYK